MQAVNYQLQEMTRCVVSLHMLYHVEEQNHI